MPESPRLLICFSIRLPFLCVCACVGVNGLLCTCGGFKKKKKSPGGGGARL